MVAPALAPLAPWLATAGVGWVYYRRMRRQFGRQVYRPRRAMVRLVLLGVIACGLIVAGVALPHVLPGLAAGALAGAVLGGFALRHTRIDRIAGVREYTPNPWIGGVLAALLVARLAWRWRDGAFAFGAASAGQHASPLTFAFIAALIVYGLVSGIGLALRMRALPAQTPQSPTRTIPADDGMV